MRLSTITALRTASLFSVLFAVGCADLPEEDAADLEENTVTADAEQALETYASAFNLIASHSGKCVTVQNGSTADGANVWQNICDTQDRRRFTLQATNDGYYQIIAKHSNKCLGVVNSGTTDGTDINQYTCNTSANQRFKAVPMGDGTFSLVAKHSNKCVDVAYSQMNDGIDLWQWSCNGNANQRFILKSVETTGNLLYGQWQSSGGRNATHGGNRTIIVDYSGPTRPVKFDLWSGVDTYLYLLDSNGNVLAEDDDSGDGTNSRLTATLSTGTYKLVSATYDSGKSGEFAVNSDFASLRFPNKLFVRPATQFNWIYDDDGTGSHDDVAVWRPDMSKYPGYHLIGDVVMNRYNKAPRTSFVVKGEGDVLAPPTDYTQVWNDYAAGGEHDGAFWEPIPPAGYECIGHVATLGRVKPSTNLVRCIKSEYLLPASWEKVWDDSGSGANMNVTVWQTNPNDYRSLRTSHFKARGHYEDPQPGSKFLSINKSALANDEYRGGAVTGLRASQFAPIVHLHDAERYKPSSARFFLDNTHADNGFLVTNQSLGCANCTDPAFLDGQHPVNDRVPVYAEIVHRDSLSIDTTDVIYWMFYPYNNGKVVAGKRFGNHVGDWEHLTVRFIDGRPAQAYLAQHSHGDAYDIGSKDLSFDDFHPRIHAAEGSHGLYADTGRHVYADYYFAQLADDTSMGLEWSTYKTVVPFEWDPSGNYDGDLDFLTITERWGNRKSECGIFDIYAELAGECVLNDGPQGPLQKGFALPSYTGFQ